MNRLLTLLLPAVLASFQTTSPDQSTAEPMSHRDSIASVAGTWNFSHFGAPTVSNSDAPDFASLMRPQLANASITISTDGTCSLIMAGRANNSQIAVTEESTAYIKLRLGEQADGEEFIYDKNHETLMMPLKIEVNDAKGIMPTYFRRGR